MPLLNTTTPKMLKWLLTASVAVAALTLTTAQAQTRIVGGKPVRAGDYPWMVALVFASENNTFHGHFCGGSIIDKTWILTAAHCVGDSVSQPGSVEALINTNVLGNGSGQRIRAKAIAIHPDADIALVELTAPVSVTPIELLTPGTKQAAPGTPSSVIGWGMTSEGGSGSKRLLQTTIPIVSHAACRKAYGLDLKEHTMICAGLPQGGKDACQGDSGGPLFVEGQSGNRMVQAGVVSFGDGCARPNAPGVYSRVSTAIDWIENIKTNGIKPGGNNVTGGNDFVITNPGLIANFSATCTYLNCSFDSKFSTPGNAKVTDYVWQLAGEKISFGSRITHRFNKAGTYDVNLYLIDADGEFAFRKRRVKVQAETAVDSSGMVKRRWRGHLRERQRTMIPNANGIRLPAGKLQVILHSGNNRDFDLQLQIRNATTGSWQTLEHAATRGGREMIWRKPSDAGVYRFVIIGHQGQGRFQVIARHQ